MKLARPLYYASRDPRMKVYGELDHYLTHFPVLRNIKSLIARGMLLEEEERAQKVLRELRLFPQRVDHMLKTWPQMLANESRCDLGR